MMLDEELASPFTEFLRLKLEGVVVSVAHQPSTECRKLKLNTTNLSLNILNANLFNQQCNSHKYDFPVILSAKDSINLESNSSYNTKVCLSYIDNLITLYNNYPEDFIIRWN